MARDAQSALTRVPVVSDESKTAAVAVSGGREASFEGGLGCSGEDECSSDGKDMDGYEEVISDGRSSHVSWRSECVVEGPAYSGLGSVLELRSNVRVRTCLCDSPETKSRTSTGLGEPEIGKFADAARLGFSETACQSEPSREECVCSSVFSFSLTASQRALSCSAFSRASAFCARHSLTCSSYSDFHVSTSSSPELGFEGVSVEVVACSVAGVVVVSVA